MKSSQRGALLLLIAAGVASAEPLPIAPYEKAACEIVASFLVQGAPALYGALASDAPLRALSRRDALEEIRARVGPPEGSFWTLRRGEAPHGKPSGWKPPAVFAVVWPSQLDDVVTLEMKQEEGVWKIWSIRTLGEIQGAPPKTPKKKTVTPVDAVPAKSPDERVGFWFVGACFAAPAFSAAAALVRRRRPRAGQVLLLLALVSFLAQMTLLFYKPPKPQTAARSASPEMKFIELRALAPLRAALASGEELPPIPAGPPAVAETAKLWIAHAELLGPSAKGVLQQIDGLQIAGRTPLADLMRARLAADRGSEEEALALYLRAATTPHDAFWLEEAAATSDPERARSILTKWEKAGSRDATVHYLLSSSVAGASSGEAREQFLRGWRIQPIPREDVVAAGVFSELLSDPGVAGMVNLKSPEEWKGAALELGNDPMTIPEGATALASGTYVRIASDEGELAIPGGARIAPEGTTVVAASEWRRREREAALALFEEAGVQRRRARAAMFPRLELAIDALCERNRWERVTDLTEWVTPESEGTPGAVLLARLEALLRAGRREEARALALGPVVGRSLRYGGGGALLVAIGDRMLTSGEFDAALESYKRAGMARNAPDVSSRIRQVEMRRRLASSPRIQDTPNFEVRSTHDVPPEAVAYIGRVLERELPSIADSLGLPYFERTTVSVVDWVEFATDLTGSLDILGFYDSEIVVPFANVPGYAEAIRRVLSHELTHAVLAQATDDLAPRWYHEGVASRFEDVARGENVFAQRSPGEIFSLSILDATLNHSFDPVAIGEAYITSHTLVRYLERTYGADVLLRMNAAFRAGETTEAALQLVTGKPMVALDVEFREWGRSNARAFANGPRERAIDPSVRSGIKFSRESRP